MIQVQLSMYFCATLMEFITSILENNLRVVTQQKPKSQVGHFGITFNVGSRDELDHEQGLAHFLEHTLFKGTNKRKAFHVLSRLDAIGGELNAYTTKEEICIYASFQKSHLARAIELIADIAFNSSFPVKELEKEKDVILDEINGYLDSPSDRIFDDFDALSYPTSAFGKNILGIPESVRGFTRATTLAFFQRFFATNNAVISYVGAASNDRVVSIIKRYFEPFTVQKEIPKRRVPEYAMGIQESVNLDLNQSHVLLGFQAPSLQSGKRRAATLMNNLLGGPGLNSILNINIREKHGIAYQIESSYIPSTDTGQLQIYFATEKEAVERCLKLIQKEVEKLKNKELSPLKLNQVKKQLIGHVALAQESNCNTMQGLGKSLLHFDRIETDEEVFKGIQAITSKDILESANQIFDWDNRNALFFH